MELNFKSGIENNIGGRNLNQSSLLLFFMGLVLINLIIAVGRVVLNLVCRPLLSVRYYSKGEQLVIADCFGKGSASLTGRENELKKIHAKGRGQPGRAENSNEAVSKGQPLFVKSGRFCNLKACRLNLLAK